MVCLHAQSAGVATAGTAWRKKQSNAYMGALSIKVSYKTFALVAPFASVAGANMPGCKQEQTAGSGSRGMCSLVSERDKDERRTGKRS